MDITRNTAHCIRCGRRLRCATSRARGYGWGCWRLIGKTARRLAQLARYTATQMAKAWELIEDAAIIPTAHPAVFRTVSSDGQRVYLTTTSGCTCPATAGCFHRAGVTVVTAI